MNSRQFATVAVITFIVGMVWLISDVIFNTKASIPISDKLQVLLEPVNPNFNSRTLELIGEETLHSDSIIVKDAPLLLPSSAPTPIPSVVSEAPPIIPSSPLPSASVFQAPQLPAATTTESPL